MSHPSIPLDTLCTQLAQIAPLKLAESWDNVGLLVGDRRANVSRVMTCLTISPDVVEEAIAESVDVIVAHHPLPFQPLKKITTDSITGSMLLKLIAGNVAIYSAHTAFDTAAGGINQQWAELLELSAVESLVEAEPTQELGAGRVGRLPNPMSLEKLIQKAAAAVGATCPRRIGPADQSVAKVALACGSGGSFLAAARRRGCDVLITGEATFHTCLEAEAMGIGLGLLGHYWSERFAMEKLAEQLAAEVPQLSIWPCRCERDPIQAV